MEESVTGIHILIVLKHTHFHFIHTLGQNCDEDSLFIGILSALGLNVLD